MPLPLSSSGSPFTSKANSLVPALRRAAPWCMSLWLCLMLPAAASAQVVEKTLVTAGFPFAMAANSVTNKIYVVSWTDNLGEDPGNLTVIDGNTNTIIKTIQVGNGPADVAVNSKTNKVYIANNFPFTFGGTVSVIDGATNTITATVSTGCSLEDVAVNPITNKIYVTGYWSGCNIVTVIDGATNKTTSLTAGYEPFGIAVNQLTNTIYVANNGDDTVTVIDGYTNSPIVLPVGNHPTGIAVNQDTNQIYVANNGDNTVTVIDGDTNTTAWTISVGSQPALVAVNPVTNVIYVSNEGDNTVTVIDGVTLATVTDPAGSYPQRIAVDQEHNKIYVANYGFGDNTVTLIDGATNTATNVPVTGNQPADVIVNPRPNMIYVAAAGSNEHGTTDNVTVIQGASLHPSISHSPTLPKFSSQPIGTTSNPLAVTLTNNGTATLAVSSIDPVGDFAETNNCEPSVAPGLTCTITVTFRPLFVGTRTGDLVITDNASHSPQTVSLSGTGIAQATVSPTAWTFAARTVGTTSAAKYMTLTNNLSTALTMSSITFTGANPGDFAAPTNTCGASLAAKAHCTIGVKFTPGATGTRTATLNVNDSAINGPQTVALTGVGE